MTDSFPNPPPPDQRCPCPPVDQRGLEEWWTRNSDAAIDGRGVTRTLDLELVFC